jgi:WD domain, G-beta repeat
LDLMTLAECRQTLREAAGGVVQGDATLDPIADRVGRLPLALRAIGGVLAHEITWPEIERELERGHLGDVSRSLAESLAVSVRFLPQEQQPRYRELVVFPADVPITAAAVARLWARTGGLSAFVTKQLLGEFRDRSLIQADNTLHDAYVDLLRTLVPSDQIRTLHSTLCDAYAVAPDPRDLTDEASPWSTLPDDDDQYGWRFIASDLQQAQRTPDLEGLLTDVTYLEGKLARLGIAATVADLGLLSAVEPVRLVASVIRAGTVVLNVHPEELPNQVRGGWGPLAALHHMPERPRPYFELATHSLRPADPALLGVFIGHTGSVRGCAFSPDGHYALSASGDDTLRLWEVATGILKAVWYGEVSTPCCACSPQGDRVMTGDSLGSVHLLVLVGVKAAAGVEPVDGQQAMSNLPEPGSAPLSEPKATRRKRFWLF